MTTQSNQSNTVVLKRNGSTEPLDISKIHRCLEYYQKEGNLRVSISTVAMRCIELTGNRVSTEDIHKSLISASAAMIDTHQPDYQIFAGRLLVHQLRKEAFGDIHVPDFYEHIVKMVNQGWYDSEILEKYTKEELDELGKELVHERDMNMAYIGVSECADKYLKQDRVTKRRLESIQQMYMLIPICLHMNDDPAKRMDYIKKAYHALSLSKFSLPTPVMEGVRSPVKQFSSCVKIECGDSLDSIMGSSNAVMKYISQRAGIGLNIGRIRALGSAIRNGDVVHTGLIPFIQYMQATVKSCHQGGARGGAATLFYPFWHLEFEDLIVLKNNMGMENHRARHLDYTVQFNNLFYKRLLAGKDVTLFSPHEVPGLYDAFFTSSEEFERLYTMYEEDKMIRKVQMRAVDMFSKFLKERGGTGRIYLYNADNVMRYGPFKPERAPIRQSNLCLEIALPTKEMSLEDPSKGEIALCTLAAFNLGNLEEDEIQDTANILVRMLDNLLDYQNYPVEEAKKTLKRRALGIGVINYAYWLAKNDLCYDDRDVSNTRTHELFEKLQYSLIRASVDLAKEKGACEYIEDTHWSDGLLPIDWYCKKTDNLHKAELRCDWEGLREDLKKYGIRNSTLSALMPSESSSKVSNATNGIEPPRDLCSVKKNKTGSVNQLVPEIERLGLKYKTLWNLDGNRGYLEKVAIMQKFVCQSISTNLSYNSRRYPDNSVPRNEITGDILFAASHGIKTIYYHNNNDSAGVVEQLDAVDTGCEGGACTI